MKSKLSTVAAGLIAASASPALLANDASSELERISVTGSYIKRAQNEDATPLQIIDASDIAASGEITLTDLLRDLTVNTGNSYDEQYTSSFSAGSASVGLRGLSPKNTLILVNGQRVSNYGFALGTQDTFVDLNALPLGAVERIEVLKDGASAVYGSDAIAGVINIILRNNVQSTQFRAGVGGASEGSLTQYSAGVISGFGDIADDGYNLTFSYDFLTRERLNADDRDFTRSGDFRDKPGGRLSGWSSQGGNYLSDPQNPQAFENCPGISEKRDRGDFTPGAEGQVCAFNTQPYNTLQPEVERHQFSLQGTLQLTDDIQAYSDFLYSNNRSSHVFGAPLSVGAGLRAYNQETGSLVDIPVELPVGHPDNPGSGALPFEYTFFDVGERVKANKQDFHRFLAGVNYRGLDWDWSVNVLNSQSRQREYVDNFINRYTFEDVLASGEYDFFNGNNDPQTIEALRIDTRRPGFYELNSINANASTILKELDNGPLSVAFGVDWREEEMDAGTSPEVLSGTELRPAINLVKGKRKVAAGFVELDVPVVENLNVNLAGRYDHYDDFGSAWSPKVAFHYVLGDDWLLRGSWSRGFRAPSLPEIAESNTISYGSVIDPNDPIDPGGRRGFTQVRTGNSELDAERSTNLNAGIIWSPQKGASIAVDVFEIEQDDIIAPDNAQFIINNEDQYADRIQRDDAGRLQIISNQYKNQGTRSTRGFDMDANYQVQLSNSTLQFQSTWSRLLEYEQALIAGQQPVDGSGGNILGALPKWKGNNQLRWLVSDWQWGVSLNYTSSYEQQVATQSSNPGLDNKVDSYWQVDSQLVYQGFGDTQLTLNISNLFDEQPPFDPAGGAYGYDMTQYNLRGRTANLSVVHNF
ncbi:iron complex outermembrane receptor protein [Idiomarina loihiensis]|uniref:TonB-dependent receptor plug domain-containing protein n=1 Tax=Idiomarina TaxID=135575 RepID=UPI000D71D696|nr:MULTISPECIES: TonB-dependent receptor [Idiomarina]PWW38530.1 iron complex outermembrane receptor protein [Idiomarina loihiensis]TDP48396.1 iron complex outermembrane receptor protein [Idiomarina loihiensis]TDS23562.1 iron complex outermembrane receptor protein [Idiomarina sp. H2]